MVINEEQLNLLEEYMQLLIELSTTIDYERNLQIGAQIRQVRQELLNVQ